ncbi:MAG TPA: 4Fe-4S dicluster domain-containing protein [Fimbriimonadaceae bacterium]|nr:4Fe-4S dicluster domain-containing protein [Fimbriimonadaceae bacterium]
MKNSPNQEAAQAILAREDFEVFLATLQSKGYATIGPTVKDGAIVFDSVSKAEDFPIGLRDVQSPGSYRLEPREDARLFGYNNGPTSAKRWLFPPKRQLWSVARRGATIELVPSSENIQRLALIGLRACDLKAVEIFDRVMLGRKYADEDYRLRRENALLIAVNCSTATSLCFCTSMDSGPRVQAGFDLCLTELLDERGHRFVVEAGSDKGRQILSALPTRPASRGDLDAYGSELSKAEAEISKHFDRTDIKERLYDQAESPLWKKVAQRCLSCGNCTLSCPTCFCTTVEDHADLATGSAERVRVWDSCFNQEFSYIHGGSVRPSPNSRYRQWLTHKLAAWIDQFGMSGCVGCGRCIAWCPAGIDITEEATTLSNAKPRQSQKTSTETKGARDAEAGSRPNSDSVFVSPRG